MAKVDRPPFLIAWDSARNQELLAAGHARDYRLAPAAHADLCRARGRRGPRHAGRAEPALQHRHQRPPRPQPAVRHALRRQHPQRLHHQDPEPAARGAALSAVARRWPARHLSDRRGRGGDVGPGRAAGDAGRRVDLPGLRHAAALGCRRGHHGDRLRGHRRRGRHHARHASVFRGRSDDRSPSRTAAALAAPARGIAGYPGPSSPSSASCWRRTGP